MPTITEKLEELCHQLVSISLDVMQSDSKDLLGVRSEKLKEANHKLKDLVQQHAFFIAEITKEREANDKMARTIVLISHTINGIIEAMSDSLEGTNVQEELSQYRQQLTREVTTLVDTSKTLSSFSKEMSS